MSFFFSVFKTAIATQKSDVIRQAGVIPFRLVLFHVISFRNKKCKCPISSIFFFLDLCEGGLEGV